ncbi:hypothetical protein D9619_009855 [Psilocybe cf. subviscida]|uniref:Uncharacterized protein n=1 Tax=Psilocybe cf. subviscida TaxID=2480587 RepID=A0A8H5BLW0_9AGAR|nr:hypothetical protein D9619_009855 [Psilocybe cf. subviscida]
MVSCDIFAVASQATHRTPAKPLNGRLESQFTYEILDVPRTTPLIIAFSHIQHQTSCHTYHQTTKLPPERLQIITHSPATGLRHFTSWYVRESVNLTRSIHTHISRLVDHCGLERSFERLLPRSTLSYWHLASRAGASHVPFTTIRPMLNTRQYTTLGLKDTDPPSDLPILIVRLPIIHASPSEPGRGGRLHHPGIITTTSFQFMVFLGRRFSCGSRSRLCISCIIPYHFCTLIYRRFCVHNPVLI